MQELDQTSVLIGRPRRWGLRWHHMYFLLAAFDVCTVSISLILNHKIVGIYTSSVEANQGWAEILRDSALLGKWAAAVNAPGNDVFLSNAVAKERARVQAASQSFVSHLKGARQRLHDYAMPGEAGELNALLDRVNSGTQAMSQEAELIFAALEGKDPGQAGRHMAEMDRRYDDVNEALYGFRRQVGTIQEAMFAEQAEQATHLQRLEYVIGGLILLMVVGAAIYGAKLGRQAELVQAGHIRAGLLKQLMAAQEEEQRRLARDLHDEIGQGLTSLLIGLRTVADAPSLADAKNRADELRRLGATTLEEVRRLARGLRPSVLDDLGLAPALERLLEHFSHAHGIEVKKDLTTVASLRLPEATETALFRIAQEALTNVARHAQADQVTLAVLRRPGQVQLTVADNGRGMDAISTPAGVPRGTTFGLTGMRERAELLHGSLTVVSQPGQGTKVIATLPCEEFHGQDSRADRR